MGAWVCSVCVVLSTENFIDAIKTIQIPDAHKLVSFNLKSLIPGLMELIDL